MHEANESEELLEGAQWKVFHTLADSLLWLVRCTRYDIAFAVPQLTCRTHAPRVADMQLGKRILCYLVGTASIKLHMKQSVCDSLTLTTYSDADYASQTSHRKSISAATVNLNGLLINGYCIKQSNVSLSTMESEFIVSTRCVQELLGCYELPQEIGCSVTQPMPVFMDNQAVIAQITSKAPSLRSKHIDIKYKFLKDLY